MKKLVSILITVLLVTAVLTGCATTKEEDVTIRVAGLTGATSIGMVSLMEQDELGNSANDYTFTIAGSADEITPSLIQGELDMAAIPANLASVVYNNSDGAIQILAVNTLGVVYIVEKGEAVQSFDDLKGKTIYATGKGSVPEYALRYLLSENGVDPDSDVTIEWKSEPNEVVAVLAAEDGAVAMLPQPYVTVAQSQVEGLRVAINLNEQWDNLDNGSMFITGVMVVRTEFAEEHPQAVADFLNEYKASIEYTNTNVEETAALVENYNIFKAAIAQKAIPYCNITYIDGADMKEAMQGYLQILSEQNPKAIGGTLPDDNFYYAQ